MTGLFEGIIKMTIDSSQIFIGDSTYRRNLLIIIYIDYDYDQSYL